MRVLVVGAGGHGRVVCDALQCSARAGSEVEVVGFLDDAPGLEGTSVLGVSVHGSLARRLEIDHDALVIAIGDNRVRAALFDQLRLAGERFAIVRHPSAVLAPDVRLGEGAMVCAGVVVNTGAIIGSNVILNTACSVDHDCRVGHHVHIAPGTRLGGDVQVGDGAFLGIGSAVIPGRSVGAWSIVGAGALVHRHVKAGVTVVGVPAVPLRARHARVTEESEIR